ncbi:MAG TPA: zinc metallopeptidase [Candidatus Sabulitectum sp.]|nr:zinc metallopeptidase [Candidatus Sabulitectum sp.]HPF33007.1 zinc metallopeptidase [Candidatus Sabulitectum sp.]HPJ27610.1 zinc metallopeptidase [Candidatus Sabulitectum sp.]HPR21414.1 zinc metallopeptidase [Candidatus Sabulitectum sp.]
MLFQMMYDMNSGLLIIAAAFILGMVARSMINSTYARYGKVANGLGMSGAEMARNILDNYGLAGVGIERTAGRLTDHYDPRSGTLRLSQEVYGGRSVAAIGIAAHEAGHAVQHAMGYAPIKFRNALVPVANLGSRMLFPLIFGGFFLRMGNLITIGAILYAGVLLFQLVTLPVEFNASSRAVNWLEKNRGFPPSDVDGVRKILRAAALTYVASALAALGQMVWLLMAGRRR